MKGVKGTDGVRWYWKDKARVRLIAESLPGRQIPAALAVYDVLVMLCNDAGDKRFTAHLTTINQYTGLSHRAVARALVNLESLGLVEVSEIRRRQSGAFRPRRFEITKGPVALSDYERATGGDGFLKPPAPFDSAFTSHSAPVALSATKEPVVIEEERTRENKVTKKDAGASVMTIPRAVLDKVEDRLGPGSINQDILAVTRSLVEQHGEEHFLRALSESALRLIPPRNLLPWMRSALDAQSKTGYQWAAKGAAGSLPAKLDEETRFFEGHALYRQLSGDLVSGPSFAWRRIEQLGTRLQIDTSEFQQLDTEPPRSEQERLIRRFVTLVLKATSTPSDAVA